MSGNAGKLKESCKTSKKAPDKLYEGCETTQKTPDTLP